MNKFVYFGILLAALAVENNLAYDYECNTPLLHKAHLTATSSIEGRGPEQARLYGDKAWSPKDSSYNQHLTVELAERSEIRSIATRGRLRSRDFVTEYIIQFSDDGQAWKTYESQDGVEEMFKGNTDAESVKLNNFDVPIIAQWIRINPTRWQDRISMRVELYGCDYVSDVVSFDGSALVKMDLLREPILTDRHSIRFRFKTNYPDGLIMYSRGTQRDFLAIQIRDNKMLLNIDLGAGITTSLSVGSLLDDNMWHDVFISRNRRDIIFSVDRVIVKGKIKGEFHRLDLNRAIYLGGVPNKQEGIVVTQNFTGCLENFYLNKTNIIRELNELNDNEVGDNVKYSKFNTSRYCPSPISIPITFLDESSFVELKGYEGMPHLNTSLAFRTYEADGLLIYHKFISQGYVKLFLHNGSLKIEIETKLNPLTTLDNFSEKFNDGKWHHVILSMAKNKIILKVDGRIMTTKRLLEVYTASYYFFGGVPPNIHNSVGFVGCMREIAVDGNYKPPTDWSLNDYCCSNTIVSGACQMLDRCNPNPCKHNGLCQQNSKEFKCNCINTGYGGNVCHTAQNPLSCEGYKNRNAVQQRKDILIDVDGSGPLDPFPVTCEFYSDGRVMTVIRHSNELTTPVDGFDEPGSFIQNINYDANLDQIIAVLNRSSSCSQHISYSCKHARLFGTPLRQQDEFKPYSWWVSRNNQKMDYWGGAIPGSKKCACGILGRCHDPMKWCNCDADTSKELHDSGDITEKEHLPVIQLRFGDTGTPLDEKEGEYTLGALICEGDGTELPRENLGKVQTSDLTITATESLDLFKNIVTFRVADATIDLPTFDMGHNGDIYFEFKTTTKNAVMIHSKGPQDFIKLSIINDNEIQFQYKAGDSIMALSVKSTSKFADDQWHSIYIERNRKGAKLVIDQSISRDVVEPPGPIRALRLTSPFIVGATTEYRDGFVGCIRALLLNGKLQDLKSYAKRGVYGVLEGCVGKCLSDPCLNNGTCIEGYNSYSCNCRFTGFKGPICADEIGVNLQQNSIIKYDFSGNWRSTIAEDIRIGFTTVHAKGFLLGLSSNITGEFMTVLVSNSGHLRIVFDFGFERQEIVYPDKHFGLGQFHDVHIKRKNSGATLILQVDNNDPIEYNFDIKSSADAQFNNIQYLYIGRNESMSEGFIGCISRVKFDDIYPLQTLFQQDGPSNINTFGSTLPEDFCGVEPVTHPPDFIETRPPPIVDEEKIRAAYNETDTAILGSVLTVIIIGLIIMAILIGRYMSRHKGEYLTQEDKGAELALDPDSAVVHSTTGHQVQKKKEWFI